MWEAAQFLSGDDLGEIGRAFLESPLVVLLNPKERVAMDAWIQKIVARPERFEKLSTEYHQLLKDAGGGPESVLPWSAQEISARLTSSLQDKALNATILCLDFDIPERTKHRWKEEPEIDGLRVARFFTRKQLIVGLSRENYLGGIDLRWHLSVAKRKSEPTVEEVVDCRRDFIPADIWMVYAIPPAKHQASALKGIVHLWESPEAETSAAREMRVRS